MKTLTATATITLTFGEQKIELSMDDAKKLLNELQALVGTKVNIPAMNPRPSREDWDKFPAIPYPPPVTYRQVPPMRENEVTCGANPTHLTQ